MEAERQIQFFAEGRVEAQVWREEEAGLACEENSRHVLASRRQGVRQREAIWKFLLSGPVLVCWGCVYPGCSHRRPEPGKMRKNISLSLVVLEAGKV